MQYRCIFMKDRMKSDLLPGPSAGASRSRRALAQPRFLVATMACAVAGFAYLAMAQSDRSAVPMTAPSGAAGRKVANLADLPGLVDAYGLSRQKPRLGTSSTSGRSFAAIGTGQSGFNLVESDLTSNTPSDEREPVFSPGGDFIAFVSNGKDSDKNGRIDSDGINAEAKSHVWIMNRDGSNQRQITGLYSNDMPRNQAHPSWSPDGNSLVYIDGEGDTSQLYVAQPFVNGTAPTNTPPSGERRTFFGGTKRSPAWAPGGLKIIFACNANIDNNASSAAGQFDLFSISPSGALEDGVVRVTGGSVDTVGNSTDDLNPAFSTANPDVVYFSSNRAISNNGTATPLTTGRRIWLVGADGGRPIQISDPTKRSAGTIDDQDDYPSASLVDNGIFERVAFQSNSAIDTSDVPPNGARDLNIWAIQNSTQVFSNYVEGEPRLFASDFSGNRVINTNPITGNAGLAYQAIGGVGLPEGVVVLGQGVYVASSLSGRVFGFDQETGAALNFFNSAVDSIPNASGMISDGSFFYVGSGIKSGAGVGNTTAIYRITTSGNSAGLATTSPAFSNGETPAGAITNGTEGLAFSAGNNNRYIFASIYNDNKINVYLRSTGTYVRTFTTAASSNLLSGPTGLTFGPDLNGDGFQDLYVNASKTDSVLAYAGPDPANINNNVGVGGNVLPGTFITAVVTDTQGNNSNLNAPEGIKIIRHTDSTKVDIYVSSFQNRGVGDVLPGTGDHINRYQLDTQTIDPNTPSTQVAVPNGNPALTPNGVPEDATFITFTGAKGTGYFDFNVLARSSLATDTGIPAPTPVPPAPTQAVEANSAASVVTNIISSPNNYAASELSTQAAGQTDIVGQDKAADREPAFGRSNATAQSTAQVTFASTRLYAPSPSSNARDSGGNKPGPSNPFGSNGDGGTHDIWGASTQDTTPPALIPQATGNQLFPLVAPGTQAPFSAPRTYEEGLRPGGPLRVAVVLRDLESGLALTDQTVNPPVAPGNVTVIVRQAGAERFTTSKPKVNESIPVEVAREGRSDILARSTFSLNVYDDGPPSSINPATNRAGHELQAGAVAGDGVYYCDGTGVAPSSSNDFYIDIAVNDQAGNSFNYDNVWGFSTASFQTVSAGLPDLFVSDYTAGQIFPLTLASSSDDARFKNMVPAESYYLNNSGGRAYTADGLTLIDTSIPSTFNSVGVWRVQCRGPITQLVLDKYKPNKTTQIDPNETTPGKDGPFTEPTRLIAVANSAVIWGAPYAGTTFVGPGTIVDATIQNRLKTFLDQGGRFFVSGRDVAFALTNNGQVNNDFLGSELGANFSREIATNVIDRGPGGFIAYDRTYPDTYYDLQIPFKYDANGNENYGDAALSQNPYPDFSGGPNNFGINSGQKMDTITPVTSSGTTLTTAYSVDGAVVGQRIEKTRTGGLKSRAVFFSFGFEAVNRRYRNNSPALPLIALDTRARIASSVLQYFKTGNLSGRVINDKTNEAIPNFLIKATAGSNVFFARTDANGNYSLNGLPPAQYTVDIVFLLNGRVVAEGTPGAQTSPAGFFDASPRLATVFGGQLTTDANLRPIPFTPGTIRGRVVTSKGTPTVFTDDEPINEKSVNMAVLLRSVGDTSVVKGGGKFASLTRTDVGGNFTFSNVPSNIELELVFNPVVEDIPVESGLRSGYNGPNPLIGRRIIPDSRRRSTIIAPVGDSFIVNDPDPVKYPDPDTGPASGVDADVAADSGVPIVVPEGPSIRGFVTINGVAPASATVELLDANGKSLTPRRSKPTLQDGSYVFGDVTPGNYQVRATATTADKITASKTVSVTVVQGTDAQVNIDILLYSISGTVTVNGQPAAGVTVQLLTSTNQPFTPTRQTTTSSTGTYTLVNIPNGSYRVKATQGKTSGSVAVDVADANRTNQDIVLTNQQLSGLVNLIVDGGTATPLKGATVELLTTDGKSLSPRVTTTTIDDGTYAFDEVKPGDYKVRASYMGDSATTTSTITVTSGTATSVRAIDLALHNLTVKVTDANNKVVAGATLQLVLDNATVATGVTDSNGAYTFKLIPAGKYTVMVTRANLGGQGSINVVRGTKPAVLVIKLQGDSTGANNPTAFNVKGKIYLVSLPYEVFNNPTQSNVSEKTGKLAAATIKVNVAFSVAPVNPTTGVRNYFLQRFDPLTGQYIDLDNNSEIVRGVGYLLQVVNAGTSIRMPTDPDTASVKSASLKALTDPNFEKTFTVTLHMDASSPAGGDNGINLIGFGFNPAKYGKVDFAKATVTHPDGRVAKSFAEAVKNGWIKSQITTIDSRGSTPTRVNATQAKVYGGYFVQTLVDGLKLTFNNPVK
jgi:hypothetical protein